MGVVLSAITHWAGEWLPQWLNHSCYIPFQQGHWYFTAWRKSCTFLSLSLQAHMWALITVGFWRTSVRGNRMGRGDRLLSPAQLWHFGFRINWQASENCQAYSIFPPISRSWALHSLNALHCTAFHISEHSCFRSFVAFLQAFLRIMVFCHGNVTRETKDVRWAFFASNRELKYYKAHCKRQKQSLLRDRTGLRVDFLYL